MKKFFIILFIIFSTLFALQFKEGDTVYATVNCSYYTAPNGGPSIVIDVTPSSAWEYRIKNIQDGGIYLIDERNIDVSMSKSKNPQLRMVLNFITSSTIVKIFIAILLIIISLFLLRPEIRKGIKFLKFKMSDKRVMQEFWRLKRQELRVAMFVLLPVAGTVLFFISNVFIGIGFIAFLILMIVFACWIETNYEQAIRNIKKRTRGAK